MQHNNTEHPTHGQLHRFNGNENSGGRERLVAPAGNPFDDDPGGIRRRVMTPTTRTTSPTTPPTAPLTTQTPSQPIDIMDDQVRTSFPPASPLPWDTPRRGALPNNPPGSAARAPSLDPSAHLPTTVEQLPEVAQPTASEARLPNGSKNSRAALRIASLNMRGGGSNLTLHKWADVNQLVREERLDILILQETHLTPDVQEHVSQLYQRLHIINSPHPTNPSSSDGIAIVINKSTTAWNEMPHREIIPGKALLITLNRFRSSKLTILAIYAPAGDDRLNMAFWQTLHDKWTNDRSLPKVNVMLGDFNVVESGLDRLPVKPNNTATVAKLESFRDLHNLMDGWRLDHPTSLDYTFSTQHQSSPNSRSRIDRIYVTNNLLSMTRDWDIRTTNVGTDHRLVYFQISPPGTPFVGKGRSTIPEYLIQHRKAMRAFLQLGKRLEDSLAQLEENQYQPRSETLNIQTLWKDFKRNLLLTSREFARRRAHGLDQEIADWEDRRKICLEPSTELDVRQDEQIQALDEIDAAIRQLRVKKARRNRDKMAARHHLEGETNSKYDFQLNRARKPRDTIAALQIPGSHPTEYVTSTNQMVEIATKYHSDLQNADLQNLTDDTYTARMEGVLNSLDPRVSEADKIGLTALLTQEEVSAALSQVPNSKAPGLDGIPIELWKQFAKDHKNKKDDHTDSLDIVRILTQVYNDIEEHGVTENTTFAEGWMCPLYKKKDKTEISNYRPITILNTDYKTLTRALTNRLTKVVPELIHEDQAGFMKNRSILDQTELVHMMFHRCVKERKNGAIVCLDQEKAYDKISHDFLWHTLQHLNFPQHFINLVASLYGSAITSIILNGVIGSIYRIIRGVRQGDPLSCLLFNIAIESLASMLRKSTLQGFRFPGLKERVLSTLFADDTTVFLNEDDNTAELFRVLDSWCAVSGAKFNVNKTVVIPLGSPEYRKRLTEDRSLHPTQPPLPENIHIALDGEPIRILGAFFGNDLRQDEVWQPTVERVKETLARWERGYPTLDGRCKAANTIIGGHTQYLTRVQGMPKEIQKRLEQLMDNFVNAKGGETKRNAIGIDTLRAPVNAGGKKLLDLTKRNEAIELMKLRAYLGENPIRPAWTILADGVLTANGSKNLKRMDPRCLISPFTQTWKVSVEARDLPANLKRMVKVSIKHKVKLIPVRMTQELQQDLPFWYSIGLKTGTRPIYNDQWGKCQQVNHNVLTVRDMIRHSTRSEDPTHIPTATCDCTLCESDRTAGCIHPDKCRKNGLTKLRNLRPEWDPRVPIPTPSFQDITPPNQNGREERQPVLRLLRNVPGLNHHIRVFTDWDTDPTDTLVNYEQPPQHTENWERQEVTAYTDGSCTNNGTRRASAGSGVWYATDDPRNLALRLGGENQSNNTGELTAALAAMQQNKTTRILEIVSDSTYTIDAITKHLNKWLGIGYAGVKNPEILQAITGELLQTGGLVVMTKVKGHSNDIGNDGADEKAAEGASKATPDVIDLSRGKKIKQLGADLSKMTQSLLQKHIASRKPTPIRAKTRRMLDLARYAVEELSSITNLDTAIWNSLSPGTTISKKARTFLWKGLHDAHKIGTYWEHTQVREEYMPCNPCQVPVESLTHILLECETTGQRHIWMLAKRLWQKTNTPWPNLTLGLILGVGLARFNNDDGENRPGITRLYRILISESAYLIWALRCEWRIGREQDQRRLHTIREIENRWHSVMNKRLRYDRILTDQFAYGRRALAVSLVRQTWLPVIEDEEALPANWVSDMGVLVGVGRERRPPGRNR